MKKLPDSKEHPLNTPRWVKVAGIIVLILILLFIILKITGIGGDHGPGRHGSSGQSAEQIQQMLFVRDMPLASASTVGFSE